MALLMSAHILSLSVWSAGLVYLPALFARYASVSGKRHRQQQRIINRVIFLAIASPAAVLAIITGSALVYATSAHATWLSAKLAAVALMVFFHMFCGRRLMQLEEGAHRKRRQLHLSFMVVPIVLIIVVLWLVLAKPNLGG